MADTITALTLATAEALSIPENVVHAVVMHQWSSVQKAIADYSAIEVSGLCRFVTRPKAVKARLKKLLQMREAYEASIRDGRKVPYNVHARLESCNEEITFLQNKLPKDVSAETSLEHN